MEDRGKTILAQGAENGAILGVIFVVMFGCWAAYGSVLLTYVCLILFLAVPFVAYNRLRHSYVITGGTLPFSALWFEGIMMFICGGLILSLAVFLYFRFIRPDFFIEAYNLFEQVKGDLKLPAQTLLQMETMMQVAKASRPIDFAVSMLWSTSFTGSILSLLLSAIAKRPLPSGNGQ